MAENLHLICSMIATAWKLTFCISVSHYITMVLVFGTSTSIILLFVRTLIIVIHFYSAQYNEPCHLSHEESI